MPAFATRAMFSACQMPPPTAIRPVTHVMSIRKFPPSPACLSPKGFTPSSVFLILDEKESNIARFKSNPCLQALLVFGGLPKTEGRTPNAASRRSFYRIAHNLVAGGQWHVFLGLSSSKRKPPQQNLRQIVAFFLFLIRFLIAVRRHRAGRIQPDHLE